ncbi:hypothetical protein C1645_879913, partial [Glomus cerebriforme]
MSSNKTILPLTDNAEDNINITMDDIFPSDTNYTTILKKDLRAVSHSIEIDSMWGIDTLPAYANEVKDFENEDVENEVDIENEVEDVETVVNEESAKNRVKQWAFQKEQIERIGLAFKTFKFYHIMSLVDAYYDIHTIANKNYPGQRDKQSI